MKNLLILLALILVFLKNTNAQKYYELGSYKNGFTVERSLKAFFFGYGRTVMSLNKYQLALNIDGFYTNNLFGYRAILSNRILLSQNKKHRILNRVGYASSLNESSINRHANQTPHWLLASVGYEYFIQNKLALSVSGYQYFKSEKTIPDISLGMVLMF
jgi:hypothetical protein